MTTLSTTEAECNALCEAVKEVAWLSNLLQGMTLKHPDNAVEIFEDNSGCLVLVQGRRTSSRTKHCAVRINFIHDMIEANVIKVVRCPTEFMIADPLTKPLGTVEFRSKSALLLNDPGDYPARGRPWPDRGRRAACAESPRSRDRHKVRIAPAIRTRP